MNEEPVLVFVPALIVALREAEREQGRPLSEQEVLYVRDRASVIALPPIEAARFIAARGYSDIDPDRCWEEWSIVRVRV